LCQSIIGKIYLSYQQTPKIKIDLKSKSSERIKMVLFLNSLHPARDKRLFYKEASALINAGFYVKILGPYQDSEYPQKNLEIVGMGTSRFRLITLIRLLKYGLQSYTNIIQCNEVDSWFIGIIISILRHVPIIFDAHEFYPKRGLYKNINLVQKTLFHSIRFTMNFLSMYTDHVITVSKQLAMEYSFLKCSITTINNYTIPRSIKRHLLENLQKEYVGHPLLIHTGLINQERGMQCILYGIKTLKKTFPNVLCLIIGKNSDSPKIHKVVKDFIDKEALNENIKFIDWLCYNNIPEYLQLADIGLVTFNVANYNNRIGFPHKFFEYLTAGLPVIVPLGSELEKIVTIHQSGQAISLDDPEEFASTVKKFYQILQKDPGFRERIRQVAQIYFNWEREAQKYVNLYMKIV